MTSRSFCLRLFRSEFACFVSAKSLITGGLMQQNSQKFFKKALNYMSFLFKDVSSLSKP